MTDKKHFFCLIGSICCGLLIIGIVACGGGGNSSSSNSGTVAISGKLTADQGVVLFQERSDQGVFYALTKFELVRPAYAQEVADESEGTPLVGATIELYQGAVLIASTSTDENGEFFFLDVPPGEYSISVSHPSIQPLQITGVTVLAGDTAVVQGTVTLNGETVNVDYEVDDCGTVAEYSAQLGHAQNLANAAGVSVEEVIAMREGSCMGWGQIAHALNVPPGTLGLGHTEVTHGSRPDHAGPPENHGQGNENSNGNGNGNPHGQGNGNSNGQGNSNGNGNGHGNSGNHGRP